MEEPARNLESFTKSLNSRITDFNSTSYTCLNAHNTSESIMLNTMKIIGRLILSY